MQPDTKIESWQSPGFGISTFRLGGGAICDFRSLLNVHAPWLECVFTAAQPSTLMIQNQSS